MSADKFVLLQKQVKDNSEELQKTMLDMKHWETEMKRKDQELGNRHTNQNLPPIRSKKKKITQEPPKQDKKPSTNKKSIKPCDYNAWSKFDVEKACRELDNVSESETSEEKLTSEEKSTSDEVLKKKLFKKHKKAMKEKEKGNVFVQQQKWDLAIQCYTKAIVLFPLDAIFYANRALCYLKKNILYAAEADCSFAIRLDSEYIKAYHRRASIRMISKKYKEAEQDLQKILQLEPSNKEAKTMLAVVNKKLEATKPIISSNKSTKEISYKKIHEISDSASELNKKNTIEKKIKKEETTSKVNYMPIPDWLPEKDNVAIVNPITQPPHLYSKDLMKRIQIQDVKFENTRCKNEDSQMSNTKDIQRPKPSNIDDNKIFEITKCKNENSQMSNTKDIQRPKPSNTDDNKIIEEKNTLSQLCEVEELPIVIPKAPRTAVQFLMDWRRNKSSKYRYQYLKQLSLNSLPTIFQDSMEVDIFSEILHTLQTEFIPQNDPVYQYLKDLSKIKRFRTLIMFINNAEKEGIKTLLEYCKNVENKTQEEIKELYEAYEL